MKIRQISTLGSFALLWAVLPIHAAVQPVSFGAKTDFGAGVDAESVADSVEDFDFGTRETTGFLFQRYEAGEMMAALRRALTAWRQPPVWRELMGRGMAQDFSWRVSADAYDRLYDDALEKVKSAGPITLDKVRALRWTPLRGSTRSKSSTGASDVPAAARKDNHVAHAPPTGSYALRLRTVRECDIRRLSSDENGAAQHLLEPPDRSLRLLHSEPLSIHSALSGSRRRKPREEGTLRD